MELLPELRQDIKLSQLEDDQDGFPQWCLYCPAKNQYYLLPWTEYEILKNWHLENPKKIIYKINSETSLSLTIDDVTLTRDFLIEQELIVPQSPLQQESILNKTKKNEKKVRSLKGYMSIRLPLLKPDKFITKTIRYVSFLFSKKAFIVYFLMAFIGVYLVSKQWEQFTNTFQYLMSVSNMFYFLLAVIFVKLSHEFAHAYVAKFYNCNVAAIGLAIIVFRPSLYTDVTDAWRVKNKKHRLHISSSGILVEIVIAIVSLFLWSFTPPGEFRTILFFIASFSWVSSIVINLNPLLCFDGYFILTDYFQIPNMQEVAFKLAKWRLRELLFGFNETAPYYFKKSTHRALLIYAYMAWIYRLFFYALIALAIYYFLFKVLAILFAVVHLNNYIVMPIINEIKNWWQMRHKMTINRKTIRTFILFILAGYILFVPWQSKLTLPAYLDYQHQYKIHSTRDSFVENIYIKENQKVEDGQLLLRLKNPKLQYELEQLLYEKKILREKYSLNLLLEKQLTHKSTSPNDLIENQKLIKYVKNNIALLDIRSPHAGRVNFNAQQLKKDQWFAKNTVLLEVIKKDTKVIYAYISEQDYHRIEVGMTGNYFLNQGNSLPIKVSQIDLIAKDSLVSPYQASIFGGEVKVVLDKNKKLHLLSAMFKVTMEPLGQKAKKYYPGTGQAIIKGQRESIVKRFWVYIGGVIMRETGF